jgi:hypothetical protein
MPLTKVLRSHFLARDRRPRFVCTDGGAPASAGKDVRTQNRGKTVPFCRKRARILEGVAKLGTPEERTLKASEAMM